MYLILLSISRSLSFESNWNITFSNKIRNLITFKWYYSLLWLHLFKVYKKKFPLCIKFCMFPVFYIHIVFTNIIGFCVVYANMAKTRIFSFIQCKHISRRLCLHWMQFSNPFYCFNITSNWYIYIFDPNMPKKPIYEKFKEKCKYDIKIQSKIIIVINLHCLKLDIQ